MANKLIDICEQKGIELLYAAGSAKDVYYLAGASLKRQARTTGEGLSDSQARAISEYASACVTNMGEVATAVGMDISDILLAQKYQRIHADFEDCLVLAAVERARADYLATSDEAFLRHCPVAALSPEDVLALLEG
ncbi:PIN domain-containing protein [Collinsella tanakaei]|nr:PIN domain-containing protein [Collinsella tanakaei]